MATSTRKSFKTKKAPEAVADVTRKLLLTSAARLIRHQGYAATTIRQIADSAGIQAGSVYYHFSSKDEILLEILDAGIDAVQNSVNARLAMLPVNASSRLKIAAAVEGHLIGLLEHGDFTSANIRNYGQLPVNLRKANQKLRRSYSDFWDGLLTEAAVRGDLRPGVDIHLARLVVLGAVNWTVEWYDPKQGPVLPLARQIASLISDGAFLVKPA